MISFSFDISRGLRELEEELRKYNVDWVALELKPGSQDNQLLVMIDEKDREATIIAPRFVLENQLLYDLLSYWIAEYRVKYGGVERMEKELMEMFKETLEKLGEKEEK